jgi:hypothetical protein
MAFASLCLLNFLGGFGARTIPRFSSIPRTLVESRPPSTVSIEIPHLPTTKSPPSTSTTCGVLRVAMSVLLARLEVIESRIASYACPRGATGRVHSLRLRRCFHGNTRRLQSTTQINYRPIVDNGESTSDIYVENGNENALEQAGNLGLEKQKVEQETALLSSLARKSRPRRIDAWYKKYDKHGDVAKRQELQQLDGLGDVLSVTFADLPTEQGTELLYSAVRLGDPHMVLKAMVRMIQHDGVGYSSNMLETIPSNTFSDILRLLDPAHFVKRFAELQKEVSPETAQHLKLPRNEWGYLRFCKMFLAQVNRILEVRSQKHPLSTSDMRYLLKCSRAVGSAESAHAIWRSMTSISRKDPENRIVPDAECYNHYLAAKCWGDTFNSDRRYKLRVIPSHLHLRTWTEPPHRFQGHRVGEGGIKSQASEIFRQMVEAGIPGNEETFCLMMVALAREGDVSGIAGILQRVWGVDVEAVLIIPEAEITPPTYYAPGSPFFPSEDLLFTIAHVYGINNSIPTALRLVDYVSRQYNVSIPVKVWNELLQWTYVTSTQRRGHNPETNSEDLKTGQLGVEAVTSLWDTMTVEPYNVQPTVEMYDRLVTNLLRRGRFGEARTRIEEAYSANHKHVNELSRHVRAYRSSTPYSLARTASARDVYMSRLRVRRNRQYIKRWVKLWIRSGSSMMRFNETFCAEDLPNFLQQWERFLPVRVRYSVANGTVSFATGVREANFRMQLSFADGAKRPNLLSKTLILPSRVRSARTLLGRPVFQRRERLQAKKIEEEQSLDESDI